MSSLNEVLQSMDYQDYIHDDIQFIIDENLRTVAVPANGVVIGVLGDKNTNRVNFKMNRYYNGFDMSKFEFRINYSNANGDVNYYLVNDLTIEDDTLLFTWLVNSDAALYAGDIKFVVRLLRLDGSVVLQAFNTAVQTAKVLEGLVVDRYITPDKERDILSHLKSDVDKYVSTVIASIPEDYSDLNSDVYKLKDDTCTLNALISGTSFITLSNTDFEQGYVDTATGKKGDAENFKIYWLRSKHKYFLPLKPGQSFGFNITNSEMTLYTLFYGMDDEYLGSTYNGFCVDSEAVKVSFLVRYDPANTEVITPEHQFKCNIGNMLTSKSNLLISNMASDSSILNVDDYAITTPISNFSYDTETGFFLRNTEQRNGYRCSYIYPAKELSVYCTDYEEPLYMVCYDKDMNYLGYCHVLNQNCYHGGGDLLEHFYMFTPEGTKYVGYDVNTSDEVTARVWRLISKNINVTITKDHDNVKDHSAYLAKSKVCTGQYIIDSGIPNNYDCCVLSDWDDYKYICVNYVSTIPIIFMNKNREYTIPEMTQYTTGNYMIEIPSDTVVIFVNKYRITNTTPKYNWKDISKFYLWRELKPAFCFGDSVTWLDSRMDYGEHNYIFGYESHLRSNGYQAFNFGYNGMPYGTTTNGDKGIVQQFIESNTDISKIDIAILAGGLNDVARWYTKTLSHGDCGSYTYETLSDWEYKYDNTIDAIISLIVYIKRNAPHARIILCNMIPSIATPYRDFANLKKFDSIIDDVSLLCGVTKCDLMRNMQITEHVNNTDMVYDELTHLNNNGYIAMANAIMSKINDLSNGTKNFVRWFDLNEATVSE